MASTSDYLDRWFPGEPCAGGDYQRVVAEHLPPFGKLLDLGCGANTLMERHRTAHREVWGVDFVVHPALQHPEWFRLLPQDGTIPFADQTFDVVCSHMVMEHVRDAEPFFTEISRVLKPGGVYVGASIHACHYVTWIRQAFDLVPHSWVQRLVKKLYGREEHDTFPTCYRLNSQRALRHIATAANLEWVSWDAYANQGYFSFSPLLWRQAVVLDWCLEKIYPGLGKIYFTVALRKPALAVAATAPRLAA